MAGEKETKFLPAFFVDVLPMKETYPSEKLPLHLSLFPPIQQAYDIRQYGEDMRIAINPFKPIEIVVGEPDWFGTPKEVAEKTNPVRRIEASPELLAIHEALTQALGHLLHDSTFLPYTPHISHPPADRLELGETLRMEGLSIVQKVSGESWTVADKIRLKGYPRETATR
jgi:hypothetical protein